VEWLRRWVVFTLFRQFTTYNGLTGILFVARKYTNESFQSQSIDNLPHDNSKVYEITKVKIPYFFKVAVRDKIGEYTSGKNKGKPITATQDVQPVKKPFPKEWDILEYEPVEITFLNKCLKCGKEGRPRIDKKNNENFHQPKYASNREEEYRLIYNHKQEDGKVKQCVIARFDQDDGIFTETGQVSNKVIDYVFPNYIIKNI